MGRYLVVVIFVLAGSVVAEEHAQWACCKPSTYILHDGCYDPIENTTVPMRMVCFEYHPVNNFSIVSGEMEIQFSELYKDTFSHDVACYGNSTTDRTLSNISTVALLCVTEEEEEEVLEDSTLGYCMVASVLFLGLTTIIYAAFSELRDLFGKSVINFCGSLAIGLGILSIMKLMIYEDMTACAIRGFLAYFFLMAAFFWTNSIAIQVLRDTRRPSTVEYGWREFRWYMLYSWGPPTVLTTIMAIVNYHPGEHRRPGIGLNHCWFLSSAQQWYYMYSVMTMLLLINFAIFVYVATIVWRYTFQSSHIKALKFKFSMTIRLILLMGLPWIFEMISSAVGSGSVVMAIVDVLNSLQGILVFLVLVVRKRVVKVFYQRGLLGCCSGPVEKWLAVADDAETNVVQHTDLPMQDDHYTNGQIRN